MNAAQFAAVLDVTPRRVRQMLDEGLLVTKGRAIVPIASLVRLLGAAKERSKARSGRDRLVEAQVAGARLRAERIARRFLTIDEVRDLICVLVHNGYVIARAESSLLYSELCGEAPEAMARQVAGRFERRVMGVFNGFRNGTRELTESILQDRLHNAERLDLILKRFIPQHGEDHDDNIKDPKKTEGGKGATQTATAKKRSARQQPRSRTQRDLSGPASDAPATDDRDG